MGQNKSSKQYVGQVNMMSKSPFSSMTNSPVQYSDRKRQYMGERTKLFTSHRAYLSIDYVQAEVQGLTDNFYDYTTTSLRLADIANASASSSRFVDDYKQILLDNYNYDYIPIGAKINTMGSTWLVVNPANISGIDADAVVARCNASYNSYDYYGNVVTEPLLIEKHRMLGNDNSSPENLVLMDGYFDVTCQLNDNTKKLGQNQRIVLGSKPYHITGFTDFIQEFTGDRDSVHILHFTVRIEEPTEFDDVTENFIANGRSYSFEAQIEGDSKISLNERMHFTASFIKQGKAVSATEENPLTWRWKSSVPSVATVDDLGNVTPVSVGLTQITATLEENPQITQSVVLSVVDSEDTPSIEFEGLIPYSILQYSSMQFTARYYEDGTPTDEEVTFSFAGADETRYGTTRINGNTIEVYCYKPDDTPLQITASYGDVSESVEVVLEGY